jgi:hypothetical protein
LGSQIWRLTSHNNHAGGYREEVVALLGYGIRGGRALGRDGRGAGAGQDAQGAPAGAIVAGTIIPERQWRAASRRRHTALYVVGLVSISRALLSRRFLEHVIVGVIVLAALADIARKNMDRDFARVIGWDNAKLAAYQEERRRLQSTKGDPGKAS